MSRHSASSALHTNFRGPLKILALDGAGIKGLTQLYVLKSLLETYQDISHQDALPKPCEIFDLIVGSSTGGLSAILLGRLRLSADDAISTYISLGKSSFSRYQKEHRDDAVSTASSGGLKGRLGRTMNGLLKGASRSAAKVLMENMMGVLVDGDVDLNEPFTPPEVTVDDPACKTVVVLTRKATLAPELLRSWFIGHKQHGKSSPANHACCIWEAAGAVTATAPYSDAVRFEKSGDRFLSAAPTLANPIKLVVTEAQLAFPERHIGVVVSIGAGRANVGDVAVPDWLSKSVEMMQAAEKSASEFESTGNGYSLLKYGSFFRLNTPLTSAQLEIDECEQSIKLQQVVGLYLQDARRDIECCARALVGVE